MPGEQPTTACLAALLRRSLRRLIGRSQLMVDVAAVTASQKPPLDDP